MSMAGSRSCSKREAGTVFRGGWGRVGEFFPRGSAKGWEPCRIWDGCERSPLKAMFSDHMLCLYPRATTYRLCDLSKSPLPFGIQAPSSEKLGGRQESNLMAVCSEDKVRCCKAPAPPQRECLINAGGSQAPRPPTRLPFRWFSRLTHSRIQGFPQGRPFCRGWAHLGHVVPWWVNQTKLGLSRGADEYHGPGTASLRYKWFQWSFEKSWIALVRYISSFLLLIIITTIIPGLLPWDHSLFVGNSHHSPKDWPSTRIIISASPTLRAY